MEVSRNIALFPWFKFLQSLLFWQAVWFLYFQNALTPAQAILLYAVYDVATTALEVPSGYMSDRLGRRITLITSGLCALAGVVLLALGGSFAVFVLGQALIGAGMAFSSGTDSAMLYESLSGTGRQDEVEAQELRAWRFSFVGLALSAVSGGLMARLDPTLPFWASAVAAGGVLVLTLAFRDPPQTLHEAQHDGGTGLATLRAALVHPVLLWLFGLSVLMYGFSHLPFIFGQPYILQALADIGLEGEAPAVSGAVTATMMVVSLIASLFAPGLRQALGLPALLLLAFAMQIALSGVLALTGSVIAIAALFLRMVPASFSHPFIMARIQPLLSDDSRATYVSIRSFTARLIFAASLWLASTAVASPDEMSFAEIRTVLGWYVLAGGIGLALLVLTALRIRVDTPRKAAHP